LTTHYIDEAENVDKACVINHGKIAACSSPEDMKRSLLRQELILDAEDRAALTDELALLGLPFTANGRVIVPYQGSAQEVISRLRTKLTVLKIHEPSLEDAYVEFLNTQNTQDMRNMQNSQGGQDSQNGQNGQDSQDSQNGQDSQDGQNGQDKQNSQSGQNGQNGQDSQNKQSAQNAHGRDAA
jgi:ABC-type multidrug transport system ATPase subunit